MPLTGKQRHHLRALAHHLDPIVQIGHGGMTESVMAQIEEALAAHELIKIRLGTECPMDRDAVAEAIRVGARTEIAQTIGRVIVAFRRHAKKPKVPLPTKSGKEKKKPIGSKGRRIVRKKKRVTRSGRTRLR